MNTIILNTLTGAVTEYSDLGFDSVTPTHAGSVNGLFQMIGNTDMGASIDASVETGKTAMGEARKKFVDTIFVGVKAPAQAMRLTVMGESMSWVYPLPITPAGVSRCVPGRGIRENYLAFKLENVSGQDFALDFIEVPITASASRRTR